VNTDLRDRAVLPILIPLLAVVFTEVVVFSLSRILLASGKNEAVGIALGTSLVILIGATVIASSRRPRTSTMVGALTLFVVASVAAGAYGIAKGPAYAKEEAAERPKIEVGAKNVAFDTKTLELAAGGTEIAFKNEDNQPHNIAIFPTEKELGTSLFRGSIAQAGQTLTYEVGELKAGSYYFHCDVHPQMNGTAKVS
jgi:plastocyanin